MTTSRSSGDSRLLEEPPDFSLVLGGPLYQLMRVAHLEGDVRQLLLRRIVVLAGLAWVPLLLLSLIEGRFANGAITLPFLHDLENHVRLLLALPLLIVAEMVVNQRIRPVVRQFLDRGLVPDGARPQFDAAICSAMRLRNSLTAELLLLALVYGVGVLFVWRTQFALDSTSWYGASAGGQLQPTMAGWWLGCVSLPLFQFLLLRWYFRLFIWGRFLWQVSRIELSLMPSHPDRCGGLGFLAAMNHAFAPVLLAQGTVLAGLMASRIFYSGASLVDFKVEVIGLVAVMVFAILGPMLVFVPRLAAAKRAGSRDFDLLAQRYAREFDQKWLRGGAPPTEQLLGSADIQSLADLGNTCEGVKSMRMVPFTMKTVFQLGVTTLLPIAPLLLTMISLEECLEHLLKLLF